MAFIFSFVFLLFYIISIYLIEKKYKHQNLIIIIVCFVLTYCIGIRTGWPDENVYLIAFEQAPSIFHFDITEEPFGYVEKGYYFLASLCKTIIPNSTVYLFLMGGLSMVLLYETLRKYSVIPLLGLCCYISRFLITRDFIQMRSSLAILVIIFASKYIYEKKMWKYFAFLLVAYQFHHLALLGIPLYFINKIHITDKFIVFGLVLALVGSQLFAGPISGYLENYSEDLNYVTYMQGQYVEEALGLKNPMIYFQIVILMMFTFFEPRLYKMSNYYYLYRNGYFYSTFILILFCNYTALSGRTSTIFATYEIFILPMIAKAIPKGLIRYCFYAGFCVVLTYFLYSKYSSAMAMMSLTVN